MPDGVAPGWDLFRGPGRKKVGGAYWDAVLISNPAGGARSDVRLACEHNRDGPPGGFEVPTVFEQERR